MTDSGTPDPPHLRILHVVASEAFAGVEQFIRRLAIAQHRAGHVVQVAGGEPARMRAALASAGIAFTPATTVREVARTVRRASVDVVNAHMTAADLGAVLGRHRGRPAPALVSTRHFAQRRGSTGPGALYRLVERRIDGEISISDAVAAAIGVPSTVIHPGVDPRPDVDAPREQSVLIAQRLEPEKHTGIGLRAFAAADLAARGWRLDLAGAGTQRDALSRLAADLGIAASVRFLGFRDDLPDLMDRAGVLVATCPFEHFGLTVLEAMAAGLPVVAAGAAGHVEMLAGLDERALFAPDDVAAAASALSALAADDAARNRLGAAERQRQRERFLLDAQVAGTDAAYRRAIAIRRTR